MTQDKDAPLRDDIRMLGRLLGDTVREQQGEAVFDLIERIRQTSVRFRRDDDRSARVELEQLLDELSREPYWWCVPSVTSRIWRTLLKINTTSGAAAHT